MTINHQRLYQLQADICYALSHPVRLHILDLLNDSELKSSELLEILNIPKANLSQHISVLKEAGLIKSRREGQCQYLSHSLPKIKNACHLLRELLLERLSEQNELMNEIEKDLRKVSNS